MARILVILACIGFGIARLMMPTVSEIHREDLFKDFAHLFQGGLYGAALFAFALRPVMRRALGSWGCELYCSRAVDLLDTPAHVVDGVLKSAGKRMLVLAVAMTILEIIAFELHKA